MEKVEAASGIVGLGLGTSQTFILREYVDKKREEPLIPELKGFGAASSLVGIITGATTFIPALIGITTGKGIKNRALQAVLLTYGSTTLIGGVLSGIVPVMAPPVPSARAVAPRIRLVAPPTVASRIKLVAPPTGAVGAPSVVKVGAPSAVKVGAPSVVKVGAPSAVKVGGAAGYKLSTS